MNEFDANEIVTDFLERVARNSRYTRLDAICEFLYENPDDLDAVACIVDDEELAETGLTREQVAAALAEIRADYWLERADEHNYI